MCQISLFCWILNPEWNASKLGDYFQKNFYNFFEIFEVFYCLGQLLSKTLEIYDENLGFSWFFGNVAAFEEPQLLRYWTVFKK